IAARVPRKFAGKMSLGEGGELAIPSVRQPAAAGNAHARLPAPDGPGRQVGGTRRMRQDIDEPRLPATPHRFSLRRRHDTRTLEVRGRRCAIVSSAIAFRLSDVTRAPGPP